MSLLPYDETDPKSIEEYARQLLKKSLAEVVDETELSSLYGGKGNLGQLVEDLYFKYKPNSDSEPDFKEAGVELKTTPLKKIKRGLVSKERLVFNIINYKEEYKKTFIESSFWKKNNLLLLMFYLHEEHKLNFESIFEIIRLWRIPKKDIQIIKDDWEKIKQKIIEGKAHEISEGDTLYLGACTKGSTAEESMREQPFNSIKARQRAFSLKSKYLNFIIEESLSHNYKLEQIDDEYQDIIESTISKVEEDRAGYGKLNLKDVEPIVKNPDELKEKTLEQIVTERFEKYYGQSENELKKIFNLNYKPTSKHRFFLISKAILGIQNKAIEEFEKADINIKTIRLQKNGMPKEHMSFPQIKFKEIINEEWEESEFYQLLTKRFFFIVFKADDNKQLILEKVAFWTMPKNALDEAEKVWLDTKNKIEKGNYSSFTKTTENPISHVRPKAKNAKDLMETPQGTFEKKKAFWLHRKFIIEQIG